MNGSQAHTNPADRTLQALLPAGGQYSVDRLAMHTGLTVLQVRNALQTLRRRGFAVATQPRGSYMLTPTGQAWIDSGLPVRNSRIARPRTTPRGLPARAWWLMRKEAVGITLNGLLRVIATREDKAARAGLVRYLMALEETGYLAAVGGPAQSNKTYNLARNAGPKAPIVRRGAGVVYDPNDGAIHALTRPLAVQHPQQGHAAALSAEAQRAALP